MFTRGPAVLAQHAAALQDASGGPFALGIGPSSSVMQALGRPCRPTSNGPLVESLAPATGSGVPMTA